MEVFVQQCDDPGRRGLSRSVLSLAHHNRRDAADCRKRRQIMGGKSPLAKINIRFQDRVISDFGEVSRRLWMSNEKFGVRPHEQDGKRRLTPARPRPISNLIPSRNASASRARSTDDNAAEVGAASMARASAKAWRPNVVVTKRRDADRTTSVLLEIIWLFDLWPAVIVLTPDSANPFQK